MLVQFWVVPLHCPSFPLWTVWANCYPTTDFHLSHQVAVVALGRPLCLYHATTMWSLPLDSTLLSPSLSTITSPHFPVLNVSLSSPIVNALARLSPSIRQIHEGWHHGVKACALWIPILFLRSNSFFFPLCVIFFLIISYFQRPVALKLQVYAMILYTYRKKKERLILESEWLWSGMEIANP